MKISRESLLAFYDKRCPWSNKTGSPVSAITGMIGEDLVLGLLCRFLNGKILSYGCNPGSAKGRRLDAWIATKSKLYQIEVKNWCAHSMGGLNVPDDPRELKDVAQQNLDHFLSHPRNLEAIWKVLAPMKTPDEAAAETALPLLALWAPVALQKQKKNPPPFWFTCSVPNFASVIPKQYRNTAHRKLHVFSASLYLRSLEDREIKIPMPRAEDRLKRLSTLFSQHNESSR